MWFFLLTVAVISLSGVMMPGPMFAITVAKSYKSASAGSLVAIGHGIIEIPLMILIYIGMAVFLQRELTKFVVGIIGGVVLIYLGIRMFRTTSGIAGGEDVPYNPLISGVITSLFNPSFLIWWMTIGAMLIERSMEFGNVGFGLFISTHWLCDLIWLSFVSLMVYKTKHLWGIKTQKTVLITCSLLLVGFGVWFIISGLKGF
jgi:threonine/homoserine/homoserine lactone efflux protein